AGQCAPPVRPLFFDRDLGDHVEQARLGGSPEDVGQRIHVGDVVLGVVERGGEVEGAAARQAEMLAGGQVDPVRVGVEPVGEVLNATDAGEPAAGQDGLRRVVV